MNTNLMRADWIREQREVVRDALHGDLAVKARGQRYLPKLQGQSAEQYAAYQNRGKFFPVPARTLTTLVGTALSKPPTIELPRRQDSMVRTCGIRGEPMVNIIEESLAEVLSVGQIGLLLWHPGGDINTTPRVATYHAETIVEEPTIEWRDGVQVLTKVRLADGSKQVEDGVRDVSMTLYLNEADEGRCWIKRSYWENSLQDEVTITDQRYDVGAFKLDFIPFIFASYDGIAPRTVEPPLYPICRLAIQAWATSVEKNHLLHISGHPQYWVAGAVGESDRPTSTGPGQIWILPEGTTVGREQADAGAAKAMQDEIDAAIFQMIQMGASHMGAGTKDGATSSTNRDVASMKLRGQLALLHQAVNNVEEAFKRLFEWAVMWDRGDVDAITFAMNRQFIEEGVSPQMLKVLYDMVGMQYLSPRALYRVAEKSGLTLPGVDFEVDQADIEHDPWMTRGSDPNDNPRLDA